MKTEAMREASQWVVRQSGAELDPAEHDRFCQWYQAHPTHAAAYDRLHRVWRHMGDVDRGALSSRRKTSALITCSALLVTGTLAAWLAPPISTWSADYRAVNTVRSVALPDGSTALLDAGAAIALNFEHGQRDIQLLAGEIYVVAQPRQPGMSALRVMTDDGNATALGTRFAVQTAAAGTTVTVYEHQVALDCLTCLPEQSLTLSPGESAQTGQGRLQRVTTPAQPAPIWSQGLARFENRPLSEVATELARYSGKAVLVLGEARQQRISGTVAFGDTQQALRFLLAQTPWRVRDLPGLLIVN